MRNRRRTYAALPLLSILLVLSVAFGSSAQTSTCVGCHTDDAMLKSLYQPPKIEEGEGEG